MNIKNVEKSSATPLLLSTCHSGTSFATQAIIPSTQQFIVFYAYPATISFLSSLDPKTPGSGSSFHAPSPSGPETQDVAVYSADEDAICCVPPLPCD
ncbi:hypothetical protein ACU617_23005 [Klebsiella aerogenes]